MTIKKRASKALERMELGWGIEGQLKQHALHNLKVALQAERDDIREMAARKVLACPDLMTHEAKVLAQEIRDLK